MLKTKGPQTLQIIKLHKCSEAELAQNKAADDGLKQALRNCLNEINPDMHSSVKHPKCNANKAPLDCIIMSRSHHVYFINNTEYIARAVIRILYELRCKLFHGEIGPINDYQKIYEHAFNIQRTLNQAII